MNINGSNPGLELYLRVKAGLALQGLTISAWCRERGLHHANAKQALVGAWDGPKGRRIRDEIVKDARIDRIR